MSGRFPKLLFFLLYVCSTSLSFTSSLHKGKQHQPDVMLSMVTNHDESSVSRSVFLRTISCEVSLVLLPREVTAASASYSSNARNMERLAAGDASGGSEYNNNPSTESGKKRRAMTGCKIPSARAEAAEVVLQVSSLSEKDCNMRVMGGDADFMLKAIRNLECSTCPYGISPDR